MSMMNKQDNITKQLIVALIIWALCMMNVIAGSLYLLANQ